jgi:uncharacterized protein (DUF1810 family)
MWFIFPQIKELGQSRLTMEFGISSLGEANAYLQHPVLGERLCECSRLVAGVEGRTIQEIFEYPDDMKYRSSMTLFSRATGADEIFNACLEKYFNGKPDPATLALL